jgi:putative transposase
MRANFTQLYLHCVWATWDRLPLITSEVQQQLYAAIVRECKCLNCTVIAIGGVDDHVHLLIGFPPTLLLSDLIKQVKGSSAHLITHQIRSKEFFKWQGGYGAFTVSHRDIEQIASYIHNQPSNHSQKTLISTWELP